MAEQAPRIPRAKQPGWQQRKSSCVHIGLLGAVLTVGLHDEGHEWVCGCGKVFVVARDSAGKKQIVAKP